MKEEIILGKADRDEVFRYLGYQGKEPDTKTLLLVEQCEERLLKVAVPRFTYQVFTILRESSESQIQLDGMAMPLPGTSIRKHLSGCNLAVCMGVTLSEGVDRAIRIMQLQDMAKAVIMDTVANVLIEQACDQTEQIIRKNYPEYYQTFRFGIGYGDLSIEIQQDFLDAIHAAKRIGLHATTSSMLMPVKSVTAVIGLSEYEIKGQARGCQTCRMQNNCRFREKGGHCNAT